AARKRDATATTARRECLAICAPCQPGAQDHREDESSALAQENERAPFRGGKNPAPFPSPTFLVDKLSDPPREARKILDRERPALDKRGNVSAPELRGLGGGSHEPAPVRRAARRFL